MGIVVGPTATDQSSRTDRSTDEETVARLRAWATTAVPALRDAEVIGTYSGLRPATEFRDYQISIDRDQGWVTVGGIRSTGLSACSAIGEYVADMLEEADRLEHRVLLNVTEAKS